MKQIHYTYGILGLGKSGIKVMEILQSMGHTLYVYDDKIDTLPPHTHLLQEKNISPIDRIVVSPGVQPDHPLLQVYDHVPVFTEIDLLYTLRPDLIYIGVTGTMGKSTTCVCIQQIFENAGLEAEIGGNYDQPSLVFWNTQKKYIILELSSYMLARITTLQLSYALLLNVYSHHLKWHKTIENYIQAKLNIFRFLQGEAIVGIDSPLTESMLPNFPQKTILFSTAPNSNSTVYFTQSKPKYIVDKSGTHTKISIPQRLKPFQLSLLAGFTLGKEMNIPTKTILHAWRKLPILPYRGNIHKLAPFIYSVNASKCTNLLMASQFIHWYPPKSVIWIAGGETTIQTLDSINTVKDRIVHAFLLGESESILYTHVKNMFSTTKCTTLEKTVQEAYTLARTCSYTHYIVLAPGYPSWDQFKNFEERGKLFDQYINDVIAQ